MVYNKLGQVILVKSYSNPTCTGGTETTPPTCTTPTLLSTQSRTYTGDGRTKNIDTTTYTVNTDYDETGNKVYEEVIDKATGTKKTTTYWSDTERTYHTCTGTTCTLDREEKDILVDGRRHATMIVKNGVETYRYYLTNTLGTTSLALSEDGAILEESDTNPYGDIRYGSNNNDVTTYYGLHERNDTTGLIDMEARMYDPTNLQFSAPDPISLYNPTAYLSDPSQMHMYAYAKGNPVRYNDPTGMASKAAKQSSASSKQSALSTMSKSLSSAVSSAFKSVTARFGGSSTTQTIAPGVMQGPMLLIGPQRPPVVINFQKESDRAMVSQKSIRVIEGIMIESKNPSGTITSVGRTPEDQVRIMANNVSKYGLSSQKDLYGKSGDLVLDQYPNREKMIAKMYELGPINVSKHVADQNILNVIDMAPSSLMNKNSFQNAALNSSYIETEKFYYPNHPTNPDPAFHMQIPQ